MAWTGTLFVMGVKGETEKTGLAEQIDVVNCSMSISNHPQLDTKGWSSGRATASEFVFSLKGGSASVQLERLCAAGSTVDRVTLTELKSIGTDTNKLEVYKTTDFLNCKITSVGESSSDGGDTYNTVSIAYGEKKVDYKEQKTEKGTLSNAANYHYDFKKSELIA